MKIETTIAPRKDGAVNVELDGSAYKFVADEHGRLMADIENDAHIAYLLDLGEFLPADEEDFARAAEIAGNDADDADDDGDDAPVADVPPIEAKTAPSNKPPRKVR